jgi:diguanylate cyclase (GGDEF)-like protein
MDRWDIAGIRFGAIAPNDTPHEVTHYLVSLDYALPETLWMDGIWSPTGVQQWQELMQYAGIALSHERNRIKLQRAASRDTLTDLFNRSEFVKELTRQNLGTEGSGVLFIDLDDFKAINDRYGHNIGDIALVTIAQNILKALPEQGVACRMGGDEFVIVTPSSIDAKGLAQSLIASCAEPFTTDPEPLTVSASIGVTQIREDETLEHAIQRADIALLQAKQEGKHRLVSCD